MDDRRSHFRIEFSDARPLSAAFTAPWSGRTFLGVRVLNLSLGGMDLAVSADDVEPPLESYFRVSFTINEGKRRLAYDCKLVHVERRGDTFHLGCQFLPLADPHAEEARFRSLWQFLLDEQRRQIRGQREQAAPHAI